MPIILTQAIDYLCRDKISIQTLYGEVGVYLRVFIQTV